jgi:hypothetical protein
MGDRRVQGFGGGKRHVENLVVEVRIILKRIFKKWYGDMDSSQNIIQVLKSFRRAGNEHVWGRAEFGRLVGKPEGKRHLEDQGIDGRKILN